MWAVRFEAFIATRYLRGKRKNRFLNLITIISIAGVSVGVIALIIVMSVMSGFDDTLRKTMIGNRSHLTVTYFQHTAMRDYEDVIRELEHTCPDIVASGPFVQIEALLQKAGQGQRVTTGGYIIGIDPEREPKVTQLADNLTHKDHRANGAGSLPGDNEVVLGCNLAERLGVTVNDSVRVATLKELPGPFGGRSATRNAAREWHIRFADVRV